MPWRAGWLRRERTGADPTRLPPARGRGAVARGPRSRRTIPICAPSSSARSTAPPASTARPRTRLRREALRLTQLAEEQTKAGDAVTGDAPGARGRRTSPAGPRQCSARRRQSRHSTKRRWLSEKSRYCAATRVQSSRPCSRPTVRACSPRPRTTPPGSGTPPRARSSRSCAAMRVRSARPCSRPTVPACSPRPGTRPLGSGTPPPARSSGPARP